MKPESQVIAQRYARRLCIKRLVSKMRKYGKVVTSVTDITHIEYTERAAVDEALREEQFKRGLR